MTSENKQNDVIEIDVVEIFFFYLKRWYLFVIAALTVMAAGVFICTVFVTPQYESTTKIIILNQQNNGSLTYSDMQLASQLTKDYEELIVSRDVLEQVIRECGLEDDYEDLLDRTSVENVTDTRIISITVEDPSPQEAQKIADCIRETAAEHIRAVTDVEAVNIAEAANLPTEKSSPSTMLWAVLSAGLGFLVVLVVLTALFLSDDTIKTSEDVEKYLGLSTLALVPSMDGAEKKKGRKASKRSGHTDAGSHAGHADTGNHAGRSDSGKRESRGVRRLTGEAEERPASEGQRAGGRFSGEGTAEERTQKRMPAQESAPAGQGG